MFSLIKALNFKLVLLQPVICILICTLPFVLQRKRMKYYRRMREEMKKVDEEDKRLHRERLREKSNKEENEVEEGQEWTQ